MAHRWTALLLLLLAGGAGDAAAQSKTGTAVGQFLLIEPSARLTAMGNAGVASAAGLQSIYYNPAAIGENRRYGLQVTHSEWLAGITYDYAAATLPVFPWVNLAVSLTALGSGDMEVRTVEQPHGTGEQFSVSDVALGIGAGRKITDRFSAGLQVQYVQETIWHSSLKAFMLNVGTTYQISEDGLRIGSSVSNVGTRARYRGRDLAMQYDEDADEFGDNSSLPAERFTDEFPLPVLFRVGIAKPWRLGEEMRLLTEIDAFHPSDNTESASGGLELSWRDRLALRAGYQNLGQEDSETGLTLGAGVRHQVGGLDLTFDYAWADHGRLEQAHRLTFVMLF